MRPPYRITPTILKRIASVAEKIGEINANFLTKPSPQLRKTNKIKTIHSSLKIEGNTLSREQVTAIIENKRVVGPQKDILEVRNAIRVYDSLREFTSRSPKSFLKAHAMLMDGLVDRPGRYRAGEVGVYQGTRVAHLAPPAKNVHSLMADLFDYLKSGDELTLIKSCVFHYETEFIHPFSDGNGRMGRLWQSLILLEEFPVFEFLPFESMISGQQKKYYQVLSSCDRQGESTAFVEFMLEIIDASLQELLQVRSRNLTAPERIAHFASLGMVEFTRTDYMAVFKAISTATASRDIRNGVEQKIFRKTGDKNKTRYSVVPETERG